MRRAFILNLFLILLVNLLIKPFYIFGIDIEVQNLLGPQGYGIFFTLFSFTYLFQIVNDFGIQVYNARSIAIQPGSLIPQIRGFLKLKLGLAVLYTGIIWVVAWALGYTIYGWILGLILLNQILVSLILFLRSNISGLGLYRTDSLLSALDKALMIVLIGALLYVPAWREGFTLERFVLAQTCAFLLTALIAALVIYRNRGTKEQAPAQISMLGLIKAAGPYAAAVFLMTLYTRIDTVMIEQLLVDGTREAGVYAAGFRLLDAANMIAFLFTPLLLPMFSKLLENKDELVGLLRTGFEIMWVLCISVALIGFFFREGIMQFLYTEADTHWIAVFGLLILGFIPMGLAYVFGTLQTAMGRMRRLNRVYLTLVVANIGLNFILIPRYAAEGAAIATLVTQGLATVTLIRFAVQDFGLRFRLFYILRIAGFALLTAVCLGLVKGTPDLAFIYKLLISGITVLLLGRIFHLVKPRSLLLLLKSSTQKTDDSA